MGICSKERDLKFIFKTTNKHETEISIEAEKSIAELIIMYYHKINRVDLIENDSIFFIYKGSEINPEQGDKLEEYFKLDQKYYEITVIDNNNLISKPKKVFNILFILTTNQARTIISIENDKTIKELMLEYFKKINRMDLFGDKNIFLLYGGSNIAVHQKDLIDKYFKDNQENQILVIDEEEKITNLKKLKNNQFSNYLNICFLTTSFKNIYLFIEKNKTIGESIKLFFQKINQPELYSDESIQFIFKAFNLPRDSKDLVGNIINDDNKIVLVVDPDDKIKNIW